jgi:hypothetical protein
MPNMAAAESTTGNVLSNLRSYYASPLIVPQMACARAFKPVVPKIT